jgi:hypothetical protein
MHFGRRVRALELGPLEAHCALCVRDSGGTLAAGLDVIDLDATPQPGELDNVRVSLSNVALLASRGELNQDAVGSRLEDIFAGLEPAAAYELELFYLEELERFMARPTTTDMLNELHTQPTSEQQPKSDVPAAAEASTDVRSLPPPPPLPGAHKSKRKS